MVPPEQLPCPLATVISLQRLAPFCHADRSEPRSSCHAALDTPRVRLSLKERRMARALVARDLQFRGPFLEMFFRRDASAW